MVAWIMFVKLYLNNSQDLCNYVLWMDQSGDAYP